jgi:CubicO group peptidase (beta-lactamase class C family)
MKRALPTALGLVLSLVANAARALDIIPPPSTQAQGFTIDGLRRLEQHMQGQIDQGEIAGSVILLARHGQTVLLSAQGRRDLASNAPMTPDALFRIRSMTKPVTGVAMMLLYEQGLWTLDDPVTKFIPEFAGLQVVSGLDAAGNPMLAPMQRPPTMRELMTHTAGFAYGLFADGPADTAYLNAGVLNPASNQDMIARIARLPLYGQPGAQWRYSAATDIQGAIIERLSGMSLAQFMETRLFRPLRMNDTGFFAPPQKLSRLATVYDLDPATRRLIPQPERYGVAVSAAPAFASAGGGLISTAADFARFCQMVLNGGQLDGARILKSETLALMRQNHLGDAFMITSNGVRASPLGAGVGFGLDWAVWMDPRASGAPVGEGTVSWGGSAGTWFWIDPANDLYFVGMIQRLGGTGGGLDAATRTLTYQALADRSK